MFDEFKSHFFAAGGRTEITIAADVIPLRIGLGEDQSQPDAVVVWSIDEPGSCRLTVSPSLTRKERICFVARRLGATFPMLEAFYRSGNRITGAVNVNLEDHMVRPGLAFCGRDSRSFLIPDCAFLESRGYAAVRAHFADGGPAWDTRKPIAFWRGTTTGRTEAGDWRSLPRIGLCKLGVAHPDLIDAGITLVAQLPPSAAEEIQAAGYIRDFVQPKRFGDWKYHIDIDGNTNSWPGLFQKLLTGSPVLKVASAGNWQQWYYHALEPWVNFVPVSSDLSDIVERILWLRDHPVEALAIGLAGRRLARELTFESQIELSQPLIVSAISAALTR